MRKSRLIINSLFIIFACTITVILITYEKKREKNAQKPILEGFSIFCEGDEISALYLAEDGSIWVGGRDGIKKLDVETGEVTGYIADDLELIYAAEICRAFDDSIWIGHNEGVTVLYPDGTRVDYAPPVLTGGRVNTILCTEQEVIVGTMEGADLFCIREGQWESVNRYTQAEGLLANTVNVLAEENGRLWFGSYLDNRPGGISILTRDDAGKESWQYLTVQDGLTHPYINSILILENKVFVASGQLSAGGLNELQYSPQGYYVTDAFDIEDGIPGEKVRLLYKDNAARLWITTESDGLILCKDADLSHPIQGIILTQAEGLSDNEIKKIVENDDYFFLAGRYGLTRIQKEAINELMGE